MNFDFHKSLIIPYEGVFPKVDSSVFLATDVRLIGKVTIGSHSSVWFGCVLRGDVNNIEIGSKSNIQDLSMIHVSHKGEGSIVGSEVSIGHGSILHSCVIEDSALIGMGSIVMDGVRIRQGAMVGAGSVLPPNFEVPPYCLALGVPAKVIRKLSMREIEENKKTTQRYLGVVKKYKNTDKQRIKID